MSVSPLHRRPGASVTALAAALLFAVALAVAGVGVAPAHAAAKHGTHHRAKHRSGAGHRAR